MLDFPRHRGCEAHAGWFGVPWVHQHRDSMIFHDTFMLGFPHNTDAVGPMRAAVAAVWGTLRASMPQTYDYPQYFYVRFPLRWLPSSGLGDSALAFPVDGK